MGQNDELAQELAAAVERFTVPLRMGDGVDVVALDELKSALAAVAEAWRGDPFLPKALVIHLIGLPEAVNTASYFYADERADGIRKIADELEQVVFGIASDQPDQQ